MTKLLNMGCGAVRPGLPWINMDSLYEYLSSPGSPPEWAVSLADLRKETNYINLDFTKSALPFPDGDIDGIVANHVLEHMDCLEALKMLRECFRVLKPGGVVRIGVPDASVFRRNFPEDNQENVVRLYGESPIMTNEKTFMNFTLFYGEHKQVFTEDSLWCHLANAGFKRVVRQSFKASRMSPLADLDNREPFTLFMEGMK